MLYAVIMAGGSGTRFWPKSTQQNPKQFLNLFGDRTMLQMTADRIENLIPAERILVVTNEQYVELVKEQLPSLPDENVVGEPVAKNTAPCIAYAAAVLQQKDPDATMVVLPADHFIKNSDRFITILETAASKAQENVLVTIGIKPDRPETGYGYIEFNDGNQEKIKGNEVRKVRKFTEKPDGNTAREFIKAGNYLWNSGMFIWKASTVIDQFEQYQPEIHSQIKQLEHSDPTDKKSLLGFYENCPSISIDYGIMENAESVFVVPGEFGWNDVGSWDALYELRAKDKDGNVVQAENLETAGAVKNFIQTSSDKLVALVGVENLAVVETDHAILVCDMNQAQGVKQIVEALRKKEELKRFL